MLRSEAIKKYGKSMYKKMLKTGMLTGITLVLNPDGTVDIPETDLELAYKVATKGINSVHPFEWD